MNTCRWKPLVAAIALGGASAVAQAQSSSPAFAAPADIPDPGTAVLEANLVGGRGGKVASAKASPLTLQVGLNENWAVLAGTSAYDWERAHDGSTSHTGGDTTLTLKGKLPVDDKFALGAELAVALPTARPPIGSGKTDWGLNTIASFDVSDLHFDVNFLGARLGAPDPGQGHWVGGWAIAASRPISESVTIIGELAGLVQQGISARTMAHMALSFNLSEAVTLNTGAAAGVSRAAPDWLAMIGLTIQLGRWF